MKCWETLLPHVVRHPLMRLDLMPLLKAYQQQYPGAMYSGCGGGYLIVVSATNRCPARSKSTFASLKMSSPKKVIVVRRIRRRPSSRDLRFLEEAAKLGELTVLLWPDDALEKLTGKAPKFPLAERIYFLNAVRYVSHVIEADGAGAASTDCRKICTRTSGRTSKRTANPAREKFCREQQNRAIAFLRRTN